jgi:hypothetical protein
MHIPIKFRFLFSFCLVMIIPTVIFMKNSSRQKKDDLHVTGKLTYLDKKMGDLPYWDMGLYLQKLKIISFHLRYIRMSRESASTA